MRRVAGTLVLTVFVLTLISPALAAGLETREQAVINFTTLCIDTSGGAVQTPGGTNPTLSNTFAIADILEILDAWETANATIPDLPIGPNMSRWVKDLQIFMPITNNPERGGFTAHPNAQQATLADTYYAVQILGRLNQSTDFSYDLAVNFTANMQRINATQFPDTVGGFVNTVDANASIAATFFALSTLMLYDELWRVNTSLAISWINSCQVLDSPSSSSYGGFVNGRNASSPDLQSTYMAVDSLQILGALTTINQTAAIDYILAHQKTNPSHIQSFGGFGPTPDESVATQLATLYAVATLNVLNSLTEISADQVGSWVISTQTPDGGFADSAFLTGLAPQSQFAVASLAILGQLELLQEIIGSLPFEFPWLIVIGAVVIIIIVACAIIARRAEWF